jgi:hypothetical protein
MLYSMRQKRGASLINVISYPRSLAYLATSTYNNIIIELAFAITGTSICNGQYLSIDTYPEQLCEY